MVSFYSSKRVHAPLAVGALLFLETSLLSFPNAVARWSGADYAIAAPLLMAVTLLALPTGRSQVFARKKPGFFEALTSAASFLPSGLKAIPQTLTKFRSQVLASGATVKHPS